MSFNSKYALNQHLKNDHRTFKPCFKFLEGKCEFDEDCMYNHIKVQEKQQICYKCGMMFPSKTILMIHIKAKHGHVQCRKFENNECRFTSQTCFFSHSVDVNRKENISSKQSEVESNPRERQNIKFFCLDSRNPNPPDCPQLKEKMETLLQTLTPMISEMIKKLLPEMMKQIEL